MMPMKLRFLADQIYGKGLGISSGLQDLKSCMNPSAACDDDDHNDSDDSDDSDDM